MAGKIAVMRKVPREALEKEVHNQGEDLTSARAPQYAFRACAEIVEHLRQADTRVLLVDLDGTIARLRRRPEDVRVSSRAKRILARLAALPNMTVAILSGRDARSLQKMVDVKTLRYFGLHGAEGDRKPPRISGEQRRALHHAKRRARRKLADFSGVDVEDKGLGFSVHYRGAGPEAVRGANEVLQEIMAPLRHALHVLNGKKVWEVLPRQIPGKGGAMRRLLADSPRAALAYIGDDEPDEPAFAVLDGHVTIHVGRNENTHARFYLRNPGEVLRFLGLLEKELR